MTLHDPLHVLSAPTTVELPTIIPSLHVAVTYWLAMTSVTSRANPVNTHLALNAFESFVNLITPICRVPHQHPDPHNGVFENENSTRLLETSPLTLHSSPPHDNYCRMRDFAIIQEQPSRGSDSQGLTAGRILRGAPRGLRGHREERIEPRVL